MTTQPPSHHRIWFLVVAFALLACLAPLVIVWLSRQDARRSIRQTPQTGDQAPADGVPLILYADTWPTRKTVNIEEIQGRATESDVVLGTQVIAKDLALALQQLGIASESRRMEDITDPQELLTHRDIVLIYPTRHAQPPWQVTSFIDRDLEPLVAHQDPRLSNLRLRDVAIAEDATPAGSAQSSLAAAMSYYSLHYTRGPALLEEMNSLVIYRLLQGLAEEMKAHAHE